jgi:hypothetical protein
MKTGPAAASPAGSAISEAASSEASATSTGFIKVPRPSVPDVPGVPGVPGVPPLSSASPSMPQLELVGDAPPAPDSSSAPGSDSDGSSHPPFRIKFTNKPKRQASSGPMSNRSALSEPDLAGLVFLLPDLQQTPGVPGVPGAPGVPGVLVPTTRPGPDTVNLIARLAQKIQMLQYVQEIKVLEAGHRTVSELIEQNKELVATNSYLRQRLGNQHGCHLFQDSYCGRMHKVLGLALADIEKVSDLQHRDYWRRQLVALLDRHVHILEGFGKDLRSAANEHRCPGAVAAAAVRDPRCPHCSGAASAAADGAQPSPADEARTPGSQTAEFFLRTMEKHMHKDMATLEKKMQAQQCHLDVLRDMNKDTLYKMREMEVKQTLMQRKVEEIWSLVNVPVTPPSAQKTVEVMEKTVKAMEEKLNGMADRLEANEGMAERLKANEKKLQDIMETQQPGNRVWEQMIMHEAMEKARSEIDAALQEQDARKLKDVQDLASYCERQLDEKLDIFQQITMGVSDGVTEVNKKQVYMNELVNQQASRLTQVWNACESLRALVSHHGTEIMRLREVERRSDQRQSRSEQ